MYLVNFQGPIFRNHVSTLRGQASLRHRTAESMRYQQLSREMSAASSPLGLSLDFLFLLVQRGARSSLCACDRDSEVAKVWFGKLESADSENQSAGKFWETGNLQVRKLRIRETGHQRIRI